MKKSGYSIILILLSLASLLLSCRREDIPDATFSGNVHGEAVGVRLLLGVAGEEAGTPETQAYVNVVGTKALDDPSDGTATKIEDFWLLQFNGVSDSSTLIGESQYYRYADFISVSNPNGAGIAKLIASSQDDAVFVLANTCDSAMVFPYGMTMSDLKSRVKEIRSEDDLFGRKAGSDTSRIMLNAQVNETIAAGTELNFGLKRNIARIKVILNNTTTSGDCPVIIRSLSLHNVPNTSRYFTNTLGVQPVCLPASDLVQTFNYPAVPYDAAGNTFYVPVNKRGTMDNTTPNSKGMTAPPSSTYLWVDAVYLKGPQRDTIPVTYSYYLGANLIDDYNLLANNVYNYTIDITMKGDADFDYRVDDWGPVDFTKPGLERANCYILNPAPAYDRQFKIPIDRIRTFWGGEGMTATTGYEQYDPAISADELMSKTFDAYILWTDIENVGDYVTIDMTKNTGDDAYFTATVKPGTEGNAVVAVTTTNDAGQEEIMWSWHLWITDYRPDEAGRYVSPEKGRYIYPVTGGAVHRYEGTIWNTGIYKDKFIMDRNLGALDTAYVDARTVGKGVLYYQFGRKDPLPGLKSDGKQRPAVYYPKPSLSDDLKYKPVGKSSGAFSDTTAVKYSVRYPLTFIKSTGAWTYCNKYNPTDYRTIGQYIRWQDPNVQDDKGKSLFDPCPPGYKMPKNGTWNDFNTYDATKNPKPTTNMHGGTNPPRNFPTYYNTRGGRNQSGLHYYPGTGDVEKTIYYPVHGYVVCDTGTFDYAHGQVCRNWSCSPVSAWSCNDLSFYSDYVYPSDYRPRSWGFPVRCVQE